MARSLRARAVMFLAAVFPPRAPLFLNACRSASVNVMLHLLFDPQNKIRLLKPTICQLQQAELVGPARASRFPSSHLGVHFVLFVALLSARTRLLFCVSAPQIVRRHSVTYALSISPLLNPRFGRRHTPSARVTRIPAQITIPRQP